MHTYGNEDSQGSDNLRNENDASYMNSSAFPLQSKTNRSKMSNMRKNSKIIPLNDISNVTELDYDGNMLNDLIYPVDSESLS